MSLDTSLRQKTTFNIFDIPITKVYPPTLGGWIWIVIICTLKGTKVINDKIDLQNYLKKNKITIDSGKNPLYYHQQLKKRVPTTNNTILPKRTSILQTWKKNPPKPNQKPKSTTENKDKPPITTKHTHKNPTPQKTTKNPSPKPTPPTRQNWKWLFPAGGKKYVQSPEKESLRLTKPAACQHPNYSSIC